MDLTGKPDNQTPTRYWWWARTKLEDDMSWRDVALALSDCLFLRYGSIEDAIHDSGEEGKVKWPKEQADINFTMFVKMPAGDKSASAEIIVKFEKKLKKIAISVATGEGIWFREKGIVRIPEYKRQRLRLPRSYFIRPHLVAGRKSIRIIGVAVKPAMDWRNAFEIEIRRVAVPTGTK